MKKLFLIAALFAAATQSFAQAPNNVWVRVNVLPTEGGKVCLDFYLDEITYKSEVAEFKRSAYPASNAFLLARPETGYLFAGLARDMNKNGQFDEIGIDQQVHLEWNGFFTCFYDHTDFEGGGNSTLAYQEAAEALAKMTQPTDQLFAVFTNKGAVAKRATDQEKYGYVFSSKLDNQAGDQVTFYAYGDYESLSVGGNVYYKFDHWTNSLGENVGTNRELTITVTGKETYSAHFVETTKDDWKANEQVPEKFKFDYSNTDWNPSGIETVKAANTADSAIYNISGQRVAQPTKGLFIQNGKKFVVK